MGGDYKLHGGRRGQSWSVASSAYAEQDGIME